MTDDDTLDLTDDQIPQLLTSELIMLLAHSEQVGEIVMKRQKTALAAMLGHEPSPMEYLERMPPQSVFTEEVERLLLLITAEIDRRIPVTQCVGCR